MDGWAINKRATIRTEKTKLYDFTGGISSNVGTSLNQFSRLEWAGQSSGISVRLENCGTIRLFQNLHPDTPIHKD
jgi:hypothetical protein